MDQNTDLDGFQFVYDIDINKSDLFICCCCEDSIMDDELYCSKNKNKTEHTRCLCLFCLKCCKSFVFFAF